MTDIYISHSGSDDNDGTQISPYRSLNRAVASINDDPSSLDEYTIKIKNDEDYTLITDYSGTCSIISAGVSAKFIEDVGKFVLDAENYIGKYVFFNGGAGDDKGGFRIIARISDDRIVIQNAFAGERNIPVDTGISYWISSDMPAYTLDLDCTAGVPIDNIWVTIEAEDSTSKPTITTSDSVFGANGVNGIWYVKEDNYKIRNIIFETTESSADAYCITNSGTEDGKEGLYIYNCEFTGFRDSVHSHSDSTTIENCTVHNMSDSRIHSFAFVVDGEDCSIVNNDIKGNLNPTSYSGQTGAIIATQNASGCVITGNTLHDFPSQDIVGGANFSGIITVIGHASLVANNTIYNFTADSSVNGFDAGILCFPLSGSDATIDVLYNNIIDTCRNGIYVYTGGAILYADYNCIYNSAVSDYVGTSASSNDVNRNPQFVDSENSDFRLLSTSPCLNTGKPTVDNELTNIGVYQGSAITLNRAKELVLETPTLLITGNFHNPKTSSTEYYSNEILQNSTLQSGSTITGVDRKTFIGPVTISFRSVYPLKTYSNINRAKNQFIGDLPFGYQSNKAEIRYSLAGEAVTLRSALYKSPLTLKHNTAGSDNTLINYKIFYKGRTSFTGSVDISIDKTDNNFYSFDENG